MARAGPHEYTHAPLPSPANHPENLSSWLRQDVGTGSSPVAVVVRNPTVITVCSSESGTPVSGEGDQDERDRGEENGRVFRGVVKTGPVYMPIPQDATTTTTTTRADENNLLGPSSPETETRGAKRARELDADADTERHAARRQGKRLTTKEEVSLLEICNSHAGSFGRRSDICNWWKTVADEFKKTHGRPYSWYSVRRKVEMVTKQRIKFLGDQQRRQDLDQEMMYPEWCAVLDEWIPTWQRWEASEARRIQRRDEMMRRRSRPRLGPDEMQAFARNLAFGTDGIDAGIDHSIHDEDVASEAADDPTTLSSPIPTPATTSPAMYPARSFPRQMPLPNTVKMPPGFDTMFSGSRPARPRTPPPPSPPRPISNPNPPSDERPMVNAVIETLGKLNKHLDAAATGSASRDPRPSPIISAVGRVAADSTAPIHPSNQESSQRQANTPTSVSLDIARIKDELRQEMQAELLKHRAEVQDKLDLILQVLGHHST